MKNDIEELIVKIEISNKIFTVGQLASLDHKIFFEYDDNFVKSGFEISPYNLPLKPGAQSNQLEYFNSLPGVFHDSLPDGWGLLLMDHFFEKNSFHRHEITMLQRLAYIGENAMGALSFYPCKSRTYSNKILDLSLLAKESKRIIEGNAQNILPELFIAGGSPAGARPKILVGYNETTNHIVFDSPKLPEGYEHYLIKFFAKSESSDAALIEYVYAKMARQAGINIPKFRLFHSDDGGFYFGIKRFDRVTTEKVHMHSLCGLINAPHNIPCFEYIDFIKLTYDLTKSNIEKLKAYKLMIFNVLTHNKDDHTKNFSFLYRHSQWQLAPAYDLTYSQGMGNQHAMTIAGKGHNITEEDFMFVAQKVDILPKEALIALEEVKEALTQWKTIAKQVGLNPKAFPFL